MPDSLRPAARAAAGPTPRLLDDRSRPDFPSVYRALLARAARVDVAATRIRMSGLRLEPEELRSPGSIRVLVMELNALLLRTEVDRLSLDPRADARTAQLRTRLREGTLEVRCLPLGGWAPDFSIFHGPGPDPPAPRPPAAPAPSPIALPVALIGPHWMERPYPHRGPGFASLHPGEAAHRAAQRFEAMWAEGHDVAGALRRVLGARQDPSGPEDPGPAEGRADPPDGGRTPTRSPPPTG